MSEILAGTPMMMPIIAPVERPPPSLSPPPSPERGVGLLGSLGSLSGPPDLGIVGFGTWEKNVGNAVLKSEENRS
jgi:hypothetical protein